MDHRVFNALADFENGATVLDLCQATNLFAADVVAALDELKQRGWVERIGETYVTRSLQAASVDRVIDAHLARLNEEQE